MSYEASLLFVYGVLRKGSVHPMAQYLAAHAKYISEGEVVGKMYVISYYPGMVISDDGNRVHGDIYQIEDKTLWKEIDAFEGLPDSDEYRKAVVEVKTEDGPRECTIYLYNRLVDGLQRIQSGDFLKYLQETGPNQ